MKRHLFELRPTQFAVGMFEVEKKIKKLRGFKDKELQEYLDAHPVPVVLCRNGDAHIIDHHHLVRACLEADVEKVLTEVVADFSHLGDKEFWAEMGRKKWLHLYDQFGNGPHDPTLLPMTVRGLADDQFRSLAWAIREAGGYDKSPEPFCEFKWADFFRKKVKVERTELGFKEAVGQALKLASSQEASHLPGFHRITR
jgi:hypothetical protein